MGSPEIGHNNSGSASSCYLLLVLCFFLQATLIVSIVSGGVVLRKFQHSVPGANVFKTNVKPWITTFFLLTFVTNVLCTRKYDIL